MLRSVASVSNRLRARTIPTAALRTGISLQHRRFSRTVLSTKVKKRINDFMSDDLPASKKRVSDTYGTAKNGVEMQIVLSKKESQICHLLEKVSDYIAQKRPDLPRIESRIAGGWVRDKVYIQGKALYRLFFLSSRFCSSSFWAKSATI